MADSEVTTALTETIAAFLKPAEPRSDGVFYIRDADAVAAHLASVLASVFVVLPKDQLHREWGATCDQWSGGRLVRLTREAAENDAAEATGLGGAYACLEPPRPQPDDMRIEVRLVGSWGPVTDKEQG